MTVKKALIISTLAVILTGITACAISYTKKTGKNPFKALQTCAYDLSYAQTTTTQQITIGYTDLLNQSESYRFTVDNSKLYKQLNTDNTQKWYYDITITGITWNNDIPSDSISTTTFKFVLNQTPPIGATTRVNWIKSEYTTYNTNSVKVKFYYNIYSGSEIISDTQTDTRTFTGINGLQNYTKFATSSDRNQPINQLGYNYQTATQNTATENGYYAGVPEGEEVGYETGYQAGNTYGYATGYNDGQQLASPVDIRGIMLNILSMPFTFISQAFNVTMWEGTAYEINLSNLILSLIAIATILFIINLFLHGFSAVGNYTGGTGEKISRWRMNRSQRKLNKAKTEKIKKE